MPLLEQSYKKENIPWKPTPKTSTNCRSSSPKPWSAFSVSLLQGQISELEQESSHPEFWTNPYAAAEVNRQLESLRRRHHHWQDTISQVQHLAELNLIAQSDHDHSLLLEIQQQAGPIHQQLDQELGSLAFSEPYDHLPAILTIHAGTGGDEAHFWAQTLLEMYASWAQQHRRAPEILNISYGERAGIRQATMTIQGPNAYGTLRGEIGVHRLSRVSDFDPSQRRHTSFARIELVPELPAAEQQPPAKSELRVETFRASGPGGQHVQKSDTAVRITHIPTGITASAQSERSQKQNLAAANRILLARIAAQQQQQDRAAAQAIRAQAPPAAWGNQIRSYILNPNQLVADHRTGTKLPNAKAILAGDLQPLIDAHFQFRIDSTKPHHHA